jgi:hypothetical protein
MIMSTTPHQGFGTKLIGELTKLADEFNLALLLESIPETVQLWISKFNFSLPKNKDVTMSVFQNTTLLELGASKATVCPAPQPLLREITASLLNMKKERGVTIKTSPAGAAVAHELQLADGSITLAQDCVGSWMKASVVAAERDRLLVHFLGWSAHFDEWLPRRSGKLLPVNSAREERGAVSGGQGPAKRSKVVGISPDARPPTNTVASEEITQTRHLKTTTDKLMEKTKNSSNEAKWEAQLVQLVEYKAEHGDCKVPPGWAEDPRLANWVKRQRYLKRKLDGGKPCEGMTAARAAKLTAIDFVWACGPADRPRAQPITNKATEQKNETKAKMAKDGHGPEKQDQTWHLKTTTDKLMEKTENSSNEAKWEAQLVQLVECKAEHGDCKVPPGWAEDPRLANWVSRQRYLKRKLDGGKPCEGMTAARAAKLAAIGFVWDPHAQWEVQWEAQWEVQLARLAAYKAEHGDCSVPVRGAEDPRLGTWVHTQRVLKRKLDRGEPSKGMTAARAARLTALGLVWDPPGGCRHVNPDDFYYWHFKDTKGASGGKAKNKAKKQKAAEGRVSRMSTIPSTAKTLKALQCANSTCRQTFGKCKCNTAKT